MNLYLEENGGVVRLRGVDADGKDWVIAIFQETGMYMAGYIGQSSGWNLNKSGQLIVQGGKADE